MSTHFFTHIAMERTLLWSALFGLFLGSAFFAATPSSLAKPPPIPREFRAAWVPTVANMNWPSKAGLPVEEQQAEMVRLLDVAASLHLNAIILQVRSVADAMYSSQLEPWSEYLTGEMGKPPDPAYDPLAFAIQEAHARGIELHAWFNPFRAGYKSAKSAASADHIRRTHPQLVHEYGGHQWLDPGEPYVVAHVLTVIADVVKRYDIDGVHLDDYFYPYPVKDENGKRIPFPDAESWKNRPESERGLTRDDWRRSNVDNFVKQFYQRVKKQKRWVKVGISPFGIWRPGYPDSVVGLDAYSALYADARRWQQEGWVDYLSPQLYWKIDSDGQSYPKLLQWWHEQNIKGRHLWPGNYASRLGFEGTKADDRWDKRELLDQIVLTREHPGATGNVHFSMKTFTLNYADINACLAKLYDGPALIPACPWLGDEKPQAPVANPPEPERQGTTLRATDDELVSRWVVQMRVGGTWKVKVIPKPSEAFVLVMDEDATEGYVTAISRTGIASDAVPIPVAK